MNKFFLKLTGLLFCFSVIDGLIILYLWMRCGQTHSSFYCSNFEFGVLSSIPCIPALFLLVLSLIVLALSKWYKGNVSTAVKLTVVILGIVIFVAPYILPIGQPKTYQEYQNRIEQKKIELEKQCAEFKQRLSEYNRGQSTSIFAPEPPPGCN